jgi:hypothetical protein
VYIFVQTVGSVDKVPVTTGSRLKGWSFSQVSLYLPIMNRSSCIHFGVLPNINC